MKKQLSVITISYEETTELINTYESIRDLLDLGTQWILVINQPLKNFVPGKGTRIIEGKDKGLYDALNLGLNEVNTDYFMLLHSGDIIFDAKAFSNTATPSGAAKIQIAVISVAPFAAKNSIAETKVPPVPSIGSKI